MSGRAAGRACELRSAVRGAGGGRDPGAGAPRRASPELAPGANLLEFKGRERVGRLAETPGEQSGEGAGAAAPLSKALPLRLDAGRGYSAFFAVGSFGLIQLRLPSGAGSREGQLENWLKFPDEHYQGV